MRQRAGAATLIAFALAAATAGCGWGGDPAEGGFTDCRSDQLPLRGGGAAARGGDQFPAVTSGLAAARRDPRGRSAGQILRELQGVDVDRRRADSFYDQLNAEDLEGAARWGVGPGRRALAWFAPQPELRALAATEFGLVSAQGDKVATLTSRDGAGWVRWQRRLPEGLADGGRVELHGAGEYVVAVVLAKRPEEGPPARGDLVVATLDARTKRLMACKRREVSGEDLALDVLDGGLFLPRATSTLDAGGRILIALPTGRGTAIDALDVRTLQTRWRRALPFGMSAMAAGEGLAVISRDPEVVDEDLLRTNPRIPQLVALDAASGRTRWTLPELPREYRPDGPANLVAARPWNGRVLAVATSSAVVDKTGPVRLLALDATAGQLRAVSPTLANDDRFPQLAVVGEKVLAAVSPVSGDPRLVGLDAARARRDWTRPLEVDLTDSPSLRGDELLAWGLAGSAAVRLGDGRARPLVGDWLAVSRHARAGGVEVVWDASLGMLLGLRPELLPGP